MVKVGITGGIGSGKSTVCKVFGILGIPVFEADLVAKELMNEPSIQQQLTHTFGASVYLPNNTIDRKLLAKIVFNNPPLLAQLNKIIHPAVQKTFEEWYQKQHTNYILLEAAILFESGFHQMMDKTIVVVTNSEERIQRVMQRDRMTEKQVMERMKNQWTDEQRVKMADFVISNNNDELIIPQIIEIDKKIRAHG